MIPLGSRTTVWTVVRFFSDEADLCRTNVEDGAQMTVAEGAMGIYDGISGLPFENRANIAFIIIDALG